MSIKYEWEQAWSKFEFHLTKIQQTIIITSMMIIGVIVMLLFHLIIIRLT